MPRTSEGKPVLYKPFKNTTSSNSKFFVYVKSDTKKAGKKTWTDKNTANYWATHFLWNA